jgi:hypothetical protein
VDNPTTGIRQHAERQMLPFPARSPRYFSSKSKFLVNLERLPSKRSRGDPELFKRVLSDPQSQRLLVGRASKRNEHGFDRFLPSRTLGANQSGNRVPLSETHMEGDDEVEGPPNKKARKVTFEESEGRTYSEPSWNARKTPLPKSRDRSDEQHDVDFFTSHSLNGFVDDGHYAQPCLAHYLCEPPYSFREGGDAICSELKQIPFCPQIPGVQDDKSKSIHRLDLCDENASSDNFDEAFYSQRREVETRLYEKEEESRRLENENSEPLAPWTCSYCGKENESDESHCVACNKRRKADDESKGWGSLFTNSMFGFTWVCPACRCHWKDTDLFCKACDTPRPGVKPAGNVLAKEKANAVERSILFGVPSSKLTSAANDSGRFSFGIQPKALTSDKDSSDANRLAGSIAAENDKGNVFHFGVTSSANQESTQSSTGGFVFGFPTPDTAGNSKPSSSLTNPALHEQSSQGDSNKVDGFNSVKSFVPFTPQMPVKPDDQSAIADNANQDAVSGSAPSFGFNLSPAAAPFTFVAPVVPMVAPSTNPSFTFGLRPAPAPITSAEPERSGMSDLDRTRGDEDRSKKRRAPAEGRESEDNNGKMQVQDTNITVHASPTPATTNHKPTEAGAGFSAPSSVPGFTFGTTGPKAASEETTALPSSSKPAFSFGLSNNSMGASATSAATQGFALNANAPAAPAVPSFSVATTPIPGSAPFALFGSTNATPNSAAFAFGSATPSGTVGATNTPASTTSGFGGAPNPPLGGILPQANPSSGFGFGAPASAALAIPFGSGSQSTPANPTTFGFGNPMTSTSAPLNSSFGAGHDPFSSQAPAVPNASFGSVQPFASMSAMASTPGSMSFGGPTAPPAAGPVGNGFGVPGMASFGSTSTPVIPGSGGFGGVFGSGSLPGIPPQDVTFSIGSAGSGPRRPASGGGRRIVRAKRPGARP